MKFFSLALAAVLATGFLVGPPAIANVSEQSAAHTSFQMSPPSVAPSSNSLNSSSRVESQAGMPVLVLSGRPSAGETLTVVSGPNPEGVALSFMWYSGGRHISWITGNRYPLTGADVGRTVSVTVQGAKAGQPPVVQTLSTQGNVLGGPGITPSVWSSTGGLTSFGVIQRSLSGQTVSNFNVEIAHDVRMACPNSCRISGQAVRSGASANVSFGVTLLLRNSFGSTIASQFVLLSDATPLARFSFDLSSSQLPSVGSGTFTIAPSNAGLSSRESLTTRETSVIEVFRGQNVSQFRPPVVQFEPSVRSVRQDTVKSSAGSILFSYVVPIAIDTLTECAPLVLYVAPISLTNGTPDSTTANASDLRLIVANPAGVRLDDLSVTGNRGEWGSQSKDFRFEVKVCGLTTQLGRSQTVTTQLDFSYYAFSQNFTSTLSFQTTFTGGLRWSSVNCYSGEAGMVVEAHQPVCPAGWTQTTAPVIGNKIRMISINCLRGKDFQVIRAPEPVCPPGFSITNLPVKNGKLVPKTLTCNKGEVVRVISDPFPECPSGFSITTRAVKNGKLVPITISCTRGNLLKRVSAAFPKCPAGFSRT